MTEIRQGDIWLANLKPQIGTEPGKRRPVVVVQTDLLNGVHPSTIICPITGKVQTHTTILRVYLKAKGYGLGKNSDILVDQIRAIDNKRFIKKVSKLNRTNFEKLMANLKVILDLN